MTDIPQILSATRSIGEAQSLPVRGAWHRLFQFIRSRVSTHEDAEDLLRDVAFKLLETYNAGEPIEQLSAWLFAVARNKITDWYRRKRDVTRLSNSDEDSEDKLSLDSTLRDLDSDIEGDLERKEFWSEFTDALDTLPANQRDVFIKHELEGMSFKEIAEESGEPVSALLSRKHYAILKLRKRLASYQIASQN